MSSGGVTASERNPLSSLERLPADALLGLMATFHADTRRDKIDLGVGVYRDASGRTPIMESVKQAEKLVFVQEESKVYEGPKGNPVYGRCIADLVLGGTDAVRKEELSATFATPGGCGALSVAVGVVKRATPSPRVFISGPSWPNHQHVVASHGLEPVFYPYAPSSDGSLDFSAAADALRQADRGDGLIVQGPCHNPTGLDLNETAWRDLASICSERGVIPIIDVAYHGFGTSLEDDLNGVRTFLSDLPDTLVSYSCSKNFGLYRERTGALIVSARDVPSLEATSSHVADIARASYSMPPSHGAAIVATILSDNALTASWTAEVSEMRERIRNLREQLAETLKSHDRPIAASSIERQRGMFTMLPFVQGAADVLGSDHGIYLPASGRINVAGIAEAEIPLLAERLSPFLPG